MPLRVSLNWEIFPAVICQTSAGPSGGVGRRQVERKGKGVPGIGTACAKI